MRRSLTCLLLMATGSAHAAHELDNRDIGDGQGVYAQHCAACHGADLEGQPDWQTPDENGVLPAPPHDETGHTWHHDNGLLFEYTKLGGQVTLAARGVPDFKSGMPGFEGTLSDNEIWNVLAYIRSTWPRRLRDIQKLRNPPHD